jgi:hypothetical protein
MFGGSDLDMLFVTSIASRGLELDRPVVTTPLAGSVLAQTNLSVRGIPEPR